jgi:hypothetical protein
MRPPDLSRARGDVAAALAPWARRLGLDRAWRWLLRWRRVVVPVAAVLLSLGTVSLLFVLTQKADDRQSETIVQGLSDDRCIRQFAAAASKERTELVDAQAAVTVETFQTNARLAEGLIAGLLNDDEAAVQRAVLLLAEAIAAGDEHVEQVEAAAMEAAAAEQLLTDVSAASRDDRDEFERLCAAGP